VSKGQKVTKTGYKWKFDPCSKSNLPNHRFIKSDISDALKNLKYQKEKMLLIVLICISGAIMLGNITQYQLKHVINFWGTIFRYILNILRNLACTFLLTF